MTFWNKGVKPYPYNGIKIQDFGNTPTNERIARHHGVDGSEAYAVNKSAIICFASDYLNSEESTKSQRVVTFKAFVENFKSSFNISRNIIESKKSPYRPDYLNKIGLTYSLAFNVVAHSVNEAISNMARFSELERILTFPYLLTENPGDPLEQRNPKSYILFSNLINNGSYWELFNNNKFTYSFENIRKYGLRVAISDIKIDPDLEMGFFEYNGQTYFKSYKINLELAVPNYGFSNTNEKEVNAVEQDLILNKVFDPFYYDSSFNVYDFSSATSGDTKGFPFNIPDNGWKSESGTTIQNKFVSNLQTPSKDAEIYSKNKSICLSICPNKKELLKSDVVYNTSLVKFDCYLESFDYSRTQEKIEVENSNVTTDNVVFPAGGQKISFNFKINVIASSMKQAMKNCLKLSYLYRMICLGGGTQADRTANRFLMSNLIKSPTSTGAYSNYTLPETMSNGLVAVVDTLDLEIDQDLGYFEYGTSFIPKAFSLSFTIHTKDSNFGKMIITDLEGKNKTFKAADSDSIKWPFGITYDNPKET